MRRKGRVKWVPASVLDELNDIRKSENVFGLSEAFRKMAFYSRKGRGRKGRDDFDPILGGR